MKKSFLLLLVLIAAFAVTWTVKANTPINRPANIEDDYSNAWYNTAYVSKDQTQKWTLDHEIPDNYIPVPGQDNLYMIIDDSGNIIKYVRRTVDANGKSTYEEVNPDIPDNFEPVDGLDNVYKVTDKEGSVKYLKYIRNPDDTFCFVEVDENGNPLNDGSDASEINTKTYKHVENNIYAHYNDDGIFTGYYERVKNNDGDYIWKYRSDPNLSSEIGNTQGFVYHYNTPEQTPVEDRFEQYQEDNQNALELPEIGYDTPDRIEHDDGTYTVTQTVRESREENGQTVVYEQVVTQVFSKDGTLLSSSSGDPYEVERSASNDPASVTAEDTLPQEYDRVTKQLSNLGGSFDTAKAAEVVNKLNAERKSKGLSELMFNTSSDAYQLAAIRAADMAIYNHSGSSPLYGDLDNIIYKYGISTNGYPSENLWQTPVKTASEIHSRFQANEGVRTIRESEQYTEIAVAIAEYNGQSYIAEILIN